MTARSEVPSVLVDAVEARELLRDIFRAVDLSDGDAATASDALVSAELRGVTTHGLANLAPRYLAWVESGFAQARPRWRITRGAPGLVNVDGDRGLGVVVAAQVMDAVIERARETGIAMATVHNSRHLGMAGYHAMRALDQDMIGVCTTTVRARMVPTFGREPRLGTNPIAVAVPAGGEPAFVFDAATTTVASNKVRARAAAGMPAPAGWMVTDEGVPPSSPMIPAEPFRMTPLGGTPDGSSHKGYGLAMVVDILCATLSHAGYGGLFGAGEAAHNLVAVDVGAVMPLEKFRAGMDHYLRLLKATPPAAGQERVMVPGQREHEATQRYLRDGLPLPLPAVEWLDECADRFGLASGDLTSGR